MMEFAEVSFSCAATRLSSLSFLTARSLISISIDCSLAEREKVLLLDSVPGQHRSQTEQSLARHSFECPQNSMKFH